MLWAWADLYCWGSRHRLHWRLSPTCRDVQLPASEESPAQPVTKTNTPEHVCRAASLYYELLWLAYSTQITVRQYVVIYSNHDDWAPPFTEGREGYYKYFFYLWRCSGGATTVARTHGKSAFVKIHSWRWSRSEMRNVVKPTKGKQRIVVRDAAQPDDSMTVEGEIAKTVWNKKKKVKEILNFAITKFSECMRWQTEGLAYASKRFFRNVLNSWIYLTVT